MLHSINMYRCASMISIISSCSIYGYQTCPSVHLVHPKHCLDARLKITELHTITLAPPKRNFATGLASHVPNLEDSFPMPQFFRSQILCLWITTLGSIDSAGTLADSQEKLAKVEKRNWRNLHLRPWQTSDMPKSLKSWHELSLSQSCTIFVTLEKRHIGMKWDEMGWRWMKGLFTFWG